MCTYLTLENPTKIVNHCVKLSRKIISVSHKFQFENQHQGKTNNLVYKLCDHNNESSTIWEKDWRRTVVKGQYISKQNCWAITFQNKQTNEFVFRSWQLRNTCNLNFDLKFQVFRTRQDRKTNLLVHFLGEVTAQPFCF